MNRVSIRDLSHDTSGALRRVKAGETLEITERGKVIGRLVPAEPGDDVRARLIAQGRLKPATGSREALLAAVERRLAIEPIDPQSSAVGALLTARDDQRY